MLEIYFAIGLLFFLFTIIVDKYVFEGDNSEEAKDLNDQFKEVTRNFLGWYPDAGIFRIILAAFVRIVLWPIALYAVLSLAIHLLKHREH